MKKKIPEAVTNWDKNLIITAEKYFELPIKLIQANLKQSSLLFN